jgi:hypothetical protein
MTTAITQAVAAKATAASSTGAATQPNQIRLWKIAGSVVVIGAGFLIGRHFYLKAQRTAANGRAADSAASPAALAKELYSALHAWSESVLPLWMQDSDEDSILAISQRITDLPKVSSEYKRLYNRELLDDISSALSTDELQAFRRNIERNKPINQQATPIYSQEELAGQLHACIDGWMPCSDSAIVLASHIRDYPAFKQLYKRLYNLDLETHLLSQWTFGESELVRFRQAAVGRST